MKKKVKAIIDQLNKEIQATTPSTAPMVEQLKGFKYISTNGKVKIEVVDAIQNGDQIETLTKITGLKVKRKYFKNFIIKP